MRKNSVLIIGSGGREHALAVSYAKSSEVQKVCVVPGNDFMKTSSHKIVPFTDINMMDFEGILKVAKRNSVNLVDVAQDDVLAAGFVDKFERAGFETFGPTQKASQIEWSKEWARNFMQKYNLPIPTYKVFSSPKDAYAYIKSQPDQLFFVKASGLAFGKGVIRADGKREAFAAIDAMQEFGKSGETFVIEEGLIGEEFSLFIICDGDSYLIIQSAQDHKTIYDEDKGPNTGGVGSVAPAGVVTPGVIRDIKSKILNPFMIGMRKEKRPYSGILYLGGIITKKGIKIIEFNSRWGDPEAEVILPSIQTDYLSLIEKVKQKKLDKLPIKIDKKIRISVAGCAQGYPIDYSSANGKEIFGLSEVIKIPGVAIFGSGISVKDNRFFVAGGRIFHLVAEGRNIIEARRLAYKAMSLISVEGNNLHYRTDIGWRDVKRLQKSK